VGITAWIPGWPRLWKGRYLRRAFASARPCAAPGPARMRHRICWRAWATAPGRSAPRSREHAAYLHGRGAHYLVTVKGNQPGLLRQLRSLPWKDVPPGHTGEGRGHGRAEKRVVKVVTVTAGLHFPHAAQAIQVTRRTRRLSGRKWRTETSYAITSLPAARARADQLAEWIRAHWKIENQLHWSATSPSARISPPPGPAPGRTSWPPSGTWSSASCAWPATPASPLRSAAPPATPYAHIACAQAASNSQ